MKKLCILAITVLFCMTGCITGGSVKIDGEVSVVEAKLLRLGAGTALSLMPQAVRPAYEVSTALLSNDLTDIITVADLDSRIKAEVERIGYPKDEVVILYEFVDLLKEDVKARLGVTTEAEGRDYITVIRAVVQAVHDAAEARI